MASWHLVPKAPRASLILLTGSVVISRPSYPVACRLRGISGIDPAAGEVPREASTSDIILAAGGAIQGHPQGPAAGVRAMSQAITAALTHTPLTTAATHHPELKTALDLFSPTP